MFKITSRSKKNTLSLLIPVIITIIFAYRWSNSLPFSDSFFVYKDIEDIGYWGRIYNFFKEPLHFPLGLIKGLSFPFEDANIMRGGIPLFSLPLKILYKMIGSFTGEKLFLQYFSLVEIISIFFAAFFTQKILRSFKIESFSALLLGTSLVVLSPGILYRSSHYFAVHFLTIHGPIYLSWAYLLLKLFEKPTAVKTILFLSLTFLAASGVGYYSLLGMSALSSFLLLLCAFNFLILRSHYYLNMFFSLLLSLGLGLFLSGGLHYIIGNQKNLEIPHISALYDRFNPEGIAGGYGGGYHTADLLSPILPPDGTEVLGSNGRSRIWQFFSLPFNTSILESGQYEGFSYIGTVALFLFLFLILKNIPRQISRWSSLAPYYDFSLAKRPSILLFMASFFLFILSWGYVFRIAGERFISIPTPALLLAIHWKAFVFARSIGKLALPFSLVIIFFCIIYFYQYLSRRFPHKANIIFTILFALHIWDISPYLSPTPSTKKNQITQYFQENDIKTIQSFNHKAKAIFVVPRLLDSEPWSQFCYALAYVSPLPISSATIGPPGEIQGHLNTYTRHINAILKGDLKSLYKEYGSFLIATTRPLSHQILSRSDLFLEKTTLKNGDIVLLHAQTK